MDEVVILSRDLERRIAIKLIIEFGHLWAVKVKLLSGGWRIFLTLILISNGTVTFDVANWISPSTY
jgi:hypothetical protein